VIPEVKHMLTHGSPYCKIGITYCAAFCFQDKFIVDIQTDARK